MMERHDLENLFLQAKCGNEQAFNKIYANYFSPIFKYVYYRLKNKQESEDLVQDIFLKFYKNISHFEFTDKDPLCYFFTIARNTVIDYQKKKKPILAEEMEYFSTQQDESHSIETQYLSRKIFATMKTLPQDQQDALTLKFVNNLANIQIAKILNTSEENVRQLQSRAIKKLRNYLKQ